MQFNSTKMKNYTTPGQSPKAPAGTITAIKACLDNLVTVAASEPELLDPTSPLNLVMARARVLLDALSITTPNAALADRLLATLQCVTPTALAIPPGPFKRVYLASGEVATKLTAAANDLEMLAAELDYRAGPLVYPLFDGPDTASAVPTEPRHGRTSTDLGRARLSPDQFNGRTFYLGDELGQLGMANHDGADIDPNFEQRGPTFAPLDCLAVTAADFKMTDVVLGRGGFGEVVQALWLSSGTKVAVKRLLPLKGQLNQDRPIMDTVANEALVWSNLHHPHVLPLLGVCLTSDVPFLVMPHMAGGDLTRYAWGRPHEHLRLLHEASQGMAYLHGKHIFHGDLKGNNILVDGYGRVQISDFGQARMLEEAAGDQSFGVGSVGNVRWIAPERYKRDAEYQLEPDVFAFAMVMYEVASGVVPFHEVKDLSLIVGRMVSGERPSMPSAGAPAYLPLLWPLIEQCWSHDWTTRPTFVEVVAHLARLREMPAMAVRQAIAPTIKPLRHPIAKESDPNLNYEGAIAFDPLMLDILAYVPDAIQPTTAIELPPRVAKIDIFHDMMAPAELAGDRVIWDRRMDLATGALTDLEVNQRPIGLAGLDILQRVWTQPQQRLTKLELKSCNLGPKGADQLAQFLPPTLTYLDLSYNQIGKSSTRTIALKLPLSLTALLLCCNEIGASGATAVAANLPPLLTQLDLAINWFGDEGAVAIAAKLPPSLRILDLEYNYIGDAGAAAIATHLPLPLTVLKLSNNRFGDVGAAAIATHLPLSLTVLELANNRFGDVGAAAIATHLPLSLTVLELANNRFGDVGAAAIATHLPLSLTVLKLYQNKIGDAGAIAIAAMLPPSLAELQLFGNSIGDAGAAAIAGVAPSSLKKITFERNKIQRPADIQELLAGRGIRVELPRQDWPSDNPPVPPPFPLPSADLPPRKLALSMPLIAAGATPAVDPHRSLEELAACDKLAGDLELWTQYTAFIEGASSMANVMDKPVSTVGVEILGHVLQHPTHALTRLAFVRCALHFDDIVRLAALLPVGLTTLALDGNALQDEGVSALSPRLPSTRLETLSLPANDIGDAGMEVLALHLPPTLKELRLWGNRIGDAGVRALAHRIPPALKELDLSDNAIGDFGVLAFLSYLPATLTQLHLSENQVGAIGAAAIAEWIPSTTALRRLDLIGNRIGQVGMAALGAAHRPPTLRYLELVEDDD